ncbi:MAG: hypothetical protein EAZ85_00685 [Bacteroidetes bacterium]|nr:MAG: hypothetical protein EAZ85_00685 [Bacteroidota bacterium]TAG87642.1 MAG: hypothetical protein EAZ20_10155 [Bacteroidota bacterium]
MKNLFLFCTLFIFSLSILAQKTKKDLMLNIQVVDAETNKDIAEVQIHSKFVLNQQKDIQTDFLGRASIVPALSDTISFDHPKYYHLHIILDHYEEHDFSHPLRVKLTPVHENHVKNSRYDMQGMTYTPHHFEAIHDSKNDLKFQIVEDERAIERRKIWLEKKRTPDTKTFNILDIHLRTKR